MSNNIIKKDNQVKKQDINLHELMNKIESDAVNKISVLNNNKVGSSSNDICNIMKTGRNMTYSEIRQMFG